jgi:hypothetical protein
LIEEIVFEIYKNILGIFEIEKNMNEIIPKV